jgi:phage protein D/phage baseplate assembly protein gpV
MSDVYSLPQFHVEVGGKRLTPATLRFLVELRVCQGLSLPTQAEVVFKLPVGFASDLVPAAAAGDSFCIQLGAGPRLFLGEVTATEHSYRTAGETTIRFRGYDCLHRLRKRQSPRAFPSSSVVDLARTLVRDLGLRVSSTQDGPRRPVKIQFRQSDLEFLAETAEAYGLYFFLTDDTLQFATLEGRGSPVELRWGENLLEASVENSAELSCDVSETLAWNPGRVEVHRGTATHSRAGDQVGASPTFFPATRKRVVSDRTVANQEEAELLAQGDLDRRLAHRVTVQGLAEGDPSIQPGAIVTLAGCDAKLRGRYVVCSATHVMDDRQGFTTRFSTEPPPPRPPRRATISTWGIVSDASDPLDVGRVRVRLPTYGELETDWMVVVVPGSGADKGVVFLPNVGDNVLVLLPNEDPALGIVLGGLQGSMLSRSGGEAKTPSASRTVILTPGGQRLQFDDARGTILLENSDGSWLEMSRERVRLFSNSELTIEAPGNSVFIRGSAIRFEEA